MGERPAGATRRALSYWVVAAGILAAVAAGVATDARIGSYALAGVLVVAALSRAVWSPPGPEALVVRHRWLDVALLTGLAAAIAVLAAIVPGAA